MRIQQERRKGHVSVAPVFVSGGCDNLRVANRSVPATGGTYVVRACRTVPLPSEPPAGWSVAEETNDPSVSSAIECSRNGMRVEAQPNLPHPRGSQIGLRWTAAPNTTIVSYDFDYAIRAPGDFASYGANWSWDYMTGRIDATTGQRTPVNYCLDPRNSCESQRGLYEAPLPTGSRSRAVYLDVTCMMERPQDCPPGGGGMVVVKSSRFTIDDSLPPIITTAPSGELVSSSQVLSGVADARFAATDQGGGLLEGIVEIDGVIAQRTSINELGGRCKAPFIHPRPCASSAAIALSYNTAQLADGPHSVRVLVTDATGTNAASYGPVEIITANGNAPSRERLQTVRCATTDRRLVTLAIDRSRVSFGENTFVRGKVRPPIPGAFVALVGDTSAGVAIVRPLGPNGRYRARVRPMASQRIHALVLAAGSPPRCSRRLHLRVTAATSLSASRQRLRNRQAVRLSGRVKGIGLPPSGKTVVLRVRAQGSRQWYKAGVARTDAEGRWNWRYRFRRTTHRTTYIFSARVPRQRGFPYARGRSRSVRITVIP